MTSLRSGLAHLSLLSLSMAYALIRIMTASLAFTWQHALALILLGICWYARVTGRSWSLPFLFATLVAATFYLALFVPGDVMFHTSLSHDFSGFRFTVGLHPLFLLLTLHATWSWRDRIRMWVSPPPSQDELLRAEEARVELFIHNMKNKSSAELESLLRDPKALVPEARKAAEQILTSSKTS